MVQNETIQEHNRHDNREPNVAPLSQYYSEDAVVTLGIAARKVAVLQTVLRCAKFPSVDLESRRSRRTTRRLHFAFANLQIDCIQALF